MKDDKKPYQVVAAMDTETTNINDFLANKEAFTILYQIGIFDGSCLKDITADNVEDCVSIFLFKDVDNFWAAIESNFLEQEYDYIPVIMVHNLSFDIFTMSSKLLLYKDNIKVLAKSPQKPLTITICNNDDKPLLVFWDTLTFSGKSLELMGLDCGYYKAVGSWDYTLTRSPNTPLTNDEVRYAKADIYTLFAWIGWYLRSELLLDETELAHKIVTKTGVVRFKRSALFYDLTGKYLSKSAGVYWSINNAREALREDDRLFTFHAAMRGGLTFCATKHVGKVFEGKIMAFDATSQHPAQMVSHLYPVKFIEQKSEILQKDLEIIKNVSMDTMLQNFIQPFGVAFCACIEFTNLRLKKGTVFERDGIAILANSRLKKVVDIDNYEHRQVVLNNNGYGDVIWGDNYQALGKLYSADIAQVWLTELEFWNVCQVYDFDSAIAISGYDTASFIKTPDMSVLSVMFFYKKKNALKKLKAEYTAGKPLDNAEEYSDYLPKWAIDALKCGELSDIDLAQFYQFSKADLNGLFGIEATNEARRDMVLSDNGLEYIGIDSSDNLPRWCKAWYQFGQRIVGWSRVAQVLMIENLGKHAGAVINGDTDSIKLYINDDKKLDDVTSYLSRYADAVAKARAKVTDRVRINYPEYYDELNKIGDYEIEDTFTRFYAAWNKAYISDDYNITLAGIPTLTKSGETLETFARKLENDYGWTFEQVCGLVLGYNITIDSSLTRLNQRYIPHYGEFYDGKVTDYRGETSIVHAPKAIALFRMSKIIGGFMNRENIENSKLTLKNNPYTNIEPKIIGMKDGQPFIEDV